MAIDYSTEVGQVRLIITDISEDTTKQLFTDAQLNAFLTMYGQDVNRAAAKALRTIAASELLVSKKITTQDLSTDGPALSKELRALADSCVAEADKVDADGGGFLEFYPSIPTGPAEGEEVRLW